MTEDQRIKKRLRDQAYRARNKDRLTDYYRQYRDKNRDRLRAYDTQWKRVWSRRRLYGVTPEVYEELVARQNGLCAICGSAPDEGRQFHVDHCHESGRVRGLLCGKCNPMLGMAGDRIAVLEAAIAYLKKAAEL